ncbi:MAG TPA: hypothetical protein VG964_01365 [Candidatus Saccharimonadales bacterium]|nr:hypothetical protein [Candidatus Saccharimonadales bacterium]
MSDFEWVDDWPSSHEPVGEDQLATQVVEQSLPSGSAERRLRSRKARIIGPIALVGAVVGTIYTVGFLRGNNVTSGPEAGPTMGRIVRPEVVKMARTVLLVEGAGGRQIIAHPSQGGGDGETVKLASYFHNERIDISVTMARDGSGNLDPTTAYDAEVDISSCDEKFCGGKENNYEGVDMFSGDETTFTHGAWGVEHFVIPPGYERPTVDTQTKLDGPGESSETEQAKTAIKEARIWTRYADVYLGKAMLGDVQLSKKPVRHTSGTVI